MDARKENAGQEDIGQEVAVQKYGMQESRVQDRLQDSNGNVQNCTYVRCWTEKMLK